MAVQVRQEQIRVFEAPVHDELRRAALALLQEQRPDLGQDARVAWVQYAQRRVDEYGGDARQDLLRFVRIGLELGERFDEDIEWARGIMSDDQVIGVSKLDVVEIYADARRGRD